MSHFTVSVICNDPEDIEILLAPFQENNMGDCPDEYMEFNDIESECRKNWETGNDGSRDEDGELFKDRYPEFEEFMSDWYSYKFDTNEQKWGYWENPNAKWDWYEVGGRWSSMLLVDTDKVDIKFKQKNKRFIEKRKEHWVDVAKISTINWKEMAQKHFDKIIKKEKKDGDVWKILTDENHPKNREYTFFNPEYYLEKYKDRNDYIKSQISFGTYAAITPDGKWHSPGDMGWFGCSTESIDESNIFQNEFYDKIIKPYQDKFIAIVDCHI